MFGTPFGPKSGRRARAARSKARPTVSRLESRWLPSSGMTEYPVAPNSQPLGAAAGPDGNLWFVASGTSKVGKITPNGQVSLFAVSAGSRPEGITAGVDGNLWFTESSGNRIGRISTGGSVTEFALPESATTLPWDI